MILRLAQVVILAAWLFSMVWLVRVTWFPAEAGYEKVDPRHVLGLVFAWEDGADLVILDHGERVGRMVFSAGTHLVEKEGHSGADRDSGRSEVVGDSRLEEPGDLEPERTHVVSIVGSAGMNEELARQVALPAEGVLDESADVPSSSLFVKSVISLNEAYGFREGQLHIRIPEQGSDLKLRFDSMARQIEVRATMGGAALLDFKGKPEEFAALGGMTGLGAGGIPMAPGLPAGIGGLGAPPVNTPEPSLGGSEGTAGLPAGIRPQLDASYGVAEIGGRRLPVYLLRIDFGDPSLDLKLYLSEVGEPLKIATSLGYEILADVLAPLPDED